MDSVKYSIVVPLYNEESGLAVLVDERNQLLRCAVVLARPLRFEFQ